MTPAIFERITENDRNHIKSVRKNEYSNSGVKNCKAQLIAQSRVNTPSDQIAQ